MQDIIKFNLSHLGLLGISGPGAQKLLQGQLTCDMNEISSSQTRLSAMCNPQGRVIGLFRVFDFEEKYFLQMPRNLIPIIHNALKKYAVFYQVKIEDLSSHFQQIGYAGPIDLTIPDRVDTAQKINQALIIKIPGDNRYIKISEKNDELCGNENWEYFNILAGIPTIYPETSEKFLPHELNLPQLNAVSFNKGCYTGQEIIARMEYRGKLKKKLLPAVIKSEITPQRGADIFMEQKSCGNIVDFAPIGYNHFLLLIVTAHENIQTGNLSIDLEQKYILQFEKI